VGDVAALGAQSIGTQWGNGKNPVIQTAAHAALGGTAAWLTGNDPAAGALGGLTEALLSNVVPSTSGLNKQWGNVAVRFGDALYTGGAALISGVIAEAMGRDGGVAANAAQNAAVNNRLLHPDQLKTLDELEKKGVGTAEELTAVLCVLQNCDIDGLSGINTGMRETYLAGVVLLKSDPESFRSLAQSIQSAGLLSGQFAYQPMGGDFTKDAFGLRLEERVYTPFDKATTLPDSWGDWLTGTAKGLGNLNPDLPVPAPMSSADEERGAIFAAVTALLATAAVPAVKGVAGAAKGGITTGTAVNVANNIGFDISNLESKLSGYLLNPAHPQNQAKATWFSQALGFDQSNWQSLAAQLRFNPATAVPTKITQYGQTFEQIIPITGANGKTIGVPFVFMKDNSGTVRLVTGIPAKK
jgi:filamentous hemagglutinin